MTLCILCPCLHQTPMSPLYTWNRFSQKVPLMAIALRSGNQSDAIEWIGFICLNETYHDSWRCYRGQAGDTSFRPPCMIIDIQYETISKFSVAWVLFGMFLMVFVVFFLFLKQSSIPPALFGPKMPLFGCTRTRAVRSSWGQKTEGTAVGCGLLFMLLKVEVPTLHIACQNFIKLYVQISAFSLTCHLEPITGIT